MPQQGLISPAGIGLPIIELFPIAWDGRGRDQAYGVSRHFEISSDKDSFEW
jgi:hypothetical protein